MKQKQSASQEIVLPDGRFARLQPILLADVIAMLGKTGIDCHIELAVRCVTIDDRAPKRDELLAMEYQVWLCIYSVIEKQLAGAFKTKYGIA